MNADLLKASGKSCRCGNQCLSVCPAQLLPPHALMRADIARGRYYARNARLARDAAERAARDAARRQSVAIDDAVTAAINRAKAKHAKAREL